MGSLEQLEAGLRDPFDRGQLAVYADALQAQGDPRGELIAIDLERDTGNPSEELALRKRELMGTFVPEHPAIRCKYGFVDVVANAPTSILDTLLLGPLGRFLRTFTIAAPANQIRCVAMTLAMRPRPWLERLVIEQSASGHVQLPRELGLQLARALPRLQSLSVSGHSVMPLVVFPHVTRLAASPIHALAALVTDAGGYLPAVCELDLQVHQRVPRSPVVALTPKQLPALRRLDLSRSASGYHFDTFRFLAQLAIVGQLDYLKVPQLLHVEQATQLQHALDRMPSLEVLEIAGGYPSHFQLYTPAHVASV
jgi:hypothetical protein